MSLSYHQHYLTGKKKRLRHKKLSSICNCVNARVSCWEDRLLATLEPDSNPLKSELLSRPTTKTHQTNHEHTHILFTTASLSVLFTFFTHAILLLFVSSDNLPLAITYLFLSYTKLLKLNQIYTNNCI